MRFLALPAFCAFFLATPATAATFTFCGTFVKDLRGKDRIQVWSPVIDADSVPDYKSRWESFVMPHVENAVKGNAEAGRRGTQCLNPRTDRADVAALRTTMMNIARRNGILVTEAPFNPTAQDNRSSDEVAGGNESRGSDSSRTEDRDRASGQESAENGDRSTKKAASEKAEPRFLRRVPLTAPPAGYSDWEQVRFNGFNYLVKVYYAQKASKEEVRVLWRCVNESNVDVSCSIGAGKDKTYICEKPGADLGTTRSLGERATVRAGSHYTFASDWACRGTGAVSVSAHPQIAVEPL